MTEHFVIVGAQRSGTTYLYRLLEQHPDICMARPVRPEPKFFLSRNADLTGYDHYLETCFAHRSSETVLGEKSTSYIEREDCIGRIRQALPGANIVFMLRNPALRAFSNWRFSRDNGLETLGFAEALEAEDERVRDWVNDAVSVCPNAYASRGHYVRYLDAWAEHFPRNQLVLVTTESLTSDTSVVRQLVDRLGGKGGLPLADHGRVNASTSDAGEISPLIYQALRGRYRADNERLATEWGLDISPWLA